MKKKRKKEKNKGGRRGEFGLGGGGRYPPPPLLPKPQTSLGFGEEVPPLPSPPPTLSGEVLFFSLFSFFFVIFQKFWEGLSLGEGLLPSQTQTHRRHPPNRRGGVSRHRQVWSTLGSASSARRVRVAQEPSPTCICWRL